MYNFDIIGQTFKELQDFEQDKISLAGKQNDTARYLQKNPKGWLFNQSEMIDLVELYYNSKFETGELDTEGYRKLFLNVCAFRSDVASMRIDLDVKDFIFIPESEDTKWKTHLFQKRFRIWAKDNYFGELINELVENFPKFGTVVVKRVGKELFFVPLKNLANEQTAKDLKTAKFVIEKHENMSLSDMKKFPNWDTSKVKLPFGKTTTVYERYGQVPANWYYKFKGINKQVDDDETIDVVAITTIDKKGDKLDGGILFCEAIKERPYEEAHWKRINGRWLGQGEVERQLENQIARNTIANLRRRALLWSSRKIFQSPDDTLAKNLVRDVKDGEVLKIMPNGNITQVDMATRNVAEFTSAEQVWETNSDQISFTYEAATGESMPSGTPFRLGVIMSNAVNSHFNLKREKLGLFLKRVVLNQLVKIFKQDSKEDIIELFTNGDDGMNDLKKAFAETEYRERIMNWLLSDEEGIPDFEMMKQLIEEDYSKKNNLWVKIKENAYKDINASMTLAVTGEQIETRAKIETLSTLYQTLVQTGDPRAEQILSKIMALTGQNLDAVLGSRKPQLPQATPQEPQLNTLNDLANINAPQGEPAI